MRKKIIAIVILCIIIVSLVGFIFAGKSNFDSTITALSEQRNQLVRSNAIVEDELNKSKRYSSELEANNKELEQILDNLTVGSEKIESGLNRYGIINRDFESFIRQAEVTD